MKKSFILLPIICLGAYVLMTSNAAGPGLASLEERTGVFGAANCSGGGCHISISSSTGLSATVSLMSGSSTVTSYTPGSSYTIRISATNLSTSTLPRFGYQVSARHSTGNAGTMTAPAGSHISSPSGVTVCEHSSALLCTTGSGGTGTTYVMDVPWNAPAAGTGAVTLRATVNAVNFSSDALGDISRNATATITEASSTGPSPVTGTLNLCVGGTTTLSSTPTGGAWSSGSASVASVVASTGVVTGVTAGTANITYTTGTGSVSATVTVNSNPGAI